MDQESALIALDCGADNDWRGYAQASSDYDEAFADGQLRPAWRRFAEAVGRVGGLKLAQRAEQARRLLRENGVSYNSVGAPQGPDRPWELDPLPLLISADDWQTLSAGLKQRSRLINAFLADVYGPQRALRAGVLPATVVFANPLYWLACHQIGSQASGHLILHACNLARQADGRWSVLSDRTQGPSGAGYALENRIIISRTLLRDLESLHTERLASFFAALRETLQGMATDNHDNPRVVLLSPGPRSSRYFEDGYLARYLGYSLVEGSDLTVRGEQTYWKTLAGLLPVDVILRRINDGDCDPLELLADGNAGSPGLLQSVRSGKLAIANAVGSGLAESPVFQAYWPRLCRFLLGEELLLACKPTWWCGMAEGMRLLESQFDRLLLRRAYIYRAHPPVDGRTLSLAERREHLDRVRVDPSQYVVQEPLARSIAPTWLADQLQPARVVLRTFSIASADGYRVLPGGLCRVTQTPTVGDESASSGQASKDVWVLSDQPVESVSLLPRAASAVELRRSANDVTSRVADHVFWLGRYAERAEALARHLRSCVVRLTSELEPTGWKEIARLLGALGEIDDDTTSVLVSGGQAPYRAPELIAPWVFDPNKMGSLAQQLAGFQHTATQVRDRLSVDGWRIVSQLDPARLFAREVTPRRMGEILLLLNQMLNLLAAFSGIGMESMTRGHVWRFLDMGRRIERALQVLGLVRRTLVEASESPLSLLESILEIADSSMTYRHRYLASLQLAPLLDLILVDETNPRSVGYQLNALSEHVTHLPTDRIRPLPTPEERLMQHMQACLRLTDVDALTESDDTGRRTRLFQLMTSLEQFLRQLSDSITHHYLSHTAPIRQLAAVRPAAEGEP